MFLETSSSTDSRLTDVVNDEPLDSLSVTSGDHQAEDLQQCADPDVTVIDLTVDCHEHEVPYESVAEVQHHQLPASSSSSSSRGKVSRGRGASRQTGRGRHKTASDAGKTASQCRDILPAAAAVTTDNHDSNGATTLSGVEVRTLLRAKILSGSKCHSQKPGMSTFCV